MRELRWAIVVPGQGNFDPEGTYTLSRGCNRVLALAAELAERRRPSVVVLSGWAPYGGESEAAQMLAAWEGRRDVELLAEETAVNTSQNMARVLPLLLARGVEEATIVCAPAHRLRCHYFFGAVYPRFGVRCTYHSPRLRTSAGALAWEAAALTLIRRQRRNAVAELERRGNSLRSDDGEPILEACAASVSSSPSAS
ncbi:MAG TPA: ElyC/SanA/YdcF family protein [Gaiellaceae bacterium]|jgi:hypothetical protein|nr:ElyC/SanA/YdcF family protein [Gaiellaceae bacterium]